jgi:hypothetical protein
MTTLLLLALIRDVGAQGRMLALAEPRGERLRIADPIAPGAPPLLAFRYLDGRQRGRFTGLDLVLDDAGH